MVVKRQIWTMDWHMAARNCKLIVLKKLLDLAEELHIKPVEVKELDIHVESKVLAHGSKRKLP